MKGRILDHVVAAARDHRSVALATDLATGRQLLIDDDRLEGDLTLDDAAMAAIRQALRADRNRTIETATSAGDIAPIANPMGPWMRATSLSVKPCSLRRVQRPAWLRREPSAPM